MLVHGRYEPYARVKLILHLWDVMVFIGTPTVGSYRELEAKEIVLRMLMNLILLADTSKNFPMQGCIATVRS